MKIKMLKVFGSLMVAAMLVVACAPKATPTSVPATSMPVTEPTATATTEMAMPQIDCMGAASGDTLTVVYQWSGTEEASFNTIVAPFLDACGITLNAQSTRDAAVLDTMVKSTPPDVLFWPDLSPLKLYSDMLLPLDTVGADQSNFASYWISMGTVGGNWLAVPVKADPKSIIWYSPAQFQALNYTIPTTFDGLQTLVDQMVSDGYVPWSMGFNNGGAADGWAGSDFIQDILLATQGPDFVNGIIAGTTPYNDPAVLAAYQLYFKWASDPQYALGGADGTVNTPFLNSIYDVFSNPPQALMVKISGFAGGEIASQYPSLVYGTDYDFFPFPGVKGLQGGADFMMAFSDNPAAQALIAYLTSAYGGENWAMAGFGVSPNKGASGHYTDPQLIKFGAMLDSATGFTFDIGDGLGAPFNEAEWKGIVDVVQGADIPSTLDTIAAAQAESVK